MTRDPHRFRLARAGILNVWQYDEQVFDFSDGRLLLRGTNGAGKSKTLEMLLPFVLDGDKSRMTATGRQGSQLLWLMTDGASGGSTRTGYLWVELARTDADGTRHVVTCGVGIRHSTSARQATTWQFTVPTACPELVEPDGTPLSAPRCRERVLGLGGHSFEAPRAYKEHVGRLLFGLEPHAYDDLLRLLYWLRQPQVGEDLDPRRLVEMLDEALPALDEDAVRQVGEALDDLQEHGERVERLAAAAGAVASCAAVYARYAAGVLAERAAAAVGAERERSARSRAVAAQTGALAQVDAELAEAERTRIEAEQARSQARGRVAALESGPLARNQQVLHEKQRRAAGLADTAGRAREAARRAADRAADSRARCDRGTAELVAAGERLTGSTTTVQQALDACQISPGLPLSPEPVAQAGLLVGGVPAARRGSTAARAAVAVVRRAVEDVERRTSAREAAAQRAAEAEQREEREEGRLADAVREAGAAEQAWEQAVRQWTQEQPALGLDLLPASGSVSLADRARAAAQPALDAARAAESQAAAERVAAQGALRDVEARRARTLAEHDPLPPPPALPRPGRDPAQGLPLWQAIDVRDGVLAAPLEAALQASGLLDAQLLEGGTWRLADDLVLSAAVLDGPTLLDVLLAELPDGSPVAEDVVEAVLSSVALADSVHEPQGPPAVGRDGSWRLGPLSGRAGKPQAQYVGRAARQAEQARRLAELDRQAEQAGRARDAADLAERAAAEAQTALHTWLRDQPSDAVLRAAAVRRDERGRTRDDARAETTARAEQLRAATTELSRALAGLQRLGSEHGLPVERDALQQRGEALGDLEVRLEALAAEAVRLLTAARRLEEDAEGAERDAEEASSARAENEAADRAAVEASEEYRLLLDTLGADVRRLQDELVAARAEQDAAARAASAAEAAVLALTGRRGEVVGALRTAQERLADVQPTLETALTAVLALREVPGLLGAALARDLAVEERRALDALAGDATSVSRTSASVLGSWAVPPSAPADANAVYRDASTLAAGPAADQEPRVVTVGSALAVLARDAAGAEQPLAVVARRLAAEVERERELLTDRERSLFEEHLLGELGDALRSRRAEAADLVRGMNDLLAEVRTSQGIRVRLDWALRDDLGSEVPEAVSLLDRPRGSLAPEESDRLRAALSSLIEVQRSAEPEQGYAVHLARALDYRRWSAFTVRLHRPGAASWTALTRRTPLSQGEQKVVCYLPLFAAAAAHFTSVAGAAPHAPRLILLDDAFPKIDVRTHPLLFGLLVDLDLDFVLTSERLWGDHDTVPSLAVYEALRAPGERGIAQYRYTWDGHVLAGGS